MVIKRYLQRLASFISLNPIRCILWSASLLFILSYPLFYTLLTAGISKTTSIVSHVQAQHISPNVYIKQLFISPKSFSNALDDQLVDSLAKFANNFTNSNNQLPTLYSIFTHSESLDLSTQYWNLSANGVELNTDLISQLHLILYQPRIKNKKLTSATGLQLSYVYINKSDGQQFDNAISSLLNLTTASPTTQSYSYIVAKSQQDSFFKFEYSAIPYWPVPLIGCFATYSFLASYFAISWEVVPSVRSKAGLFSAFLVQSVLSISAALSLVSLFYPNFSPDSLRKFLIIPYLVVVASLGNVVRLLTAVGGTPTENHPSNRLQMGLKATYDRTLTELIVNTILLLGPCLIFFNSCSEVVQLCFFTILCFFFNFIMHMTYFSAIVFVDLRRMELSDFLINENLSRPSRQSRFNDYSGPGLLDTEYNDRQLKNPVMKLIRKQYCYFKHLYFNSRMSVSVSLFAVFIVFLTAWGWVADSNELHNFSSGTLPLFLGEQVVNKYENIEVFEPIVLEAVHGLNDNRILFYLNPGGLNGTFQSFRRVFTGTVFLEFLTLFAFCLSVAGVILKNSLPLYTDVFEPTPSKEVMEFSSKELAGYHTLDVLKIITQGSMVATVSLDHNIFVWNAGVAGSKVGQPFGIPNSPDFWPISRLVLNININQVAIFCTRLAAVKCFNYQTGELLYHLQDKELFNELPVEMFFSGMDLVIVSKTGGFLSISELGNITKFKVEFAGESQIVLHAIRLVTPRIPERVVCFSSDNETSIGTHIGNAWRFRKLHLQDSPVQVNFHGVHDLSKYKPQPIPAPIAMVARMPMRSGRLGGMAGTATSRMGMGIGTNLKKPKPKILESELVEVVAVPAINMVLVATSFQACLFDAQTGIIVKNFQLGHFKKRTLRVFHSQPTHCRFCGCASVDSLSIAYTDEETDGMVICHTLTIDNRAKNSICIRVERDPRETRCLGFESTTERQHWIRRVEGWDITDMNMIMGVRRKEPKSTAVSGSALGSSSIWSRTTFLHRRKVDSRREDDDQSHHLTQDADAPHFPLIDATWEGFAMSATGEVEYYDIPDTTASNRTALAASSLNYGHTSWLGHSQTRSRARPVTIGTELEMAAQARLLIASIGPVRKYGTKSIAVAFGNIIKILYFGKEESLVTVDPGTDTPRGTTPLLGPRSGSGHGRTMSGLKRHPSTSMLKYNL